jgi:bifunctional UDP-N-acetylglucosamine pyrophosphorylase/glucosamine-1-phosphate N-acetyltransferase/UDP-N-acetylglucosamine pyrophosphorylase
MRDTMAVVLAAGKGTRMKSDLPKVLCQACGRPLIDYVLDALEGVGIERVVVVVGYRADDVRGALADRRGLEFVEQREQQGTGHAVMVCGEQLATHEGAVLILAGDSPLVQRRSLELLMEDYRFSRAACLLGTLHKADPSGLGRIVRDESGAFVGIVEEKDASPEQRRLTEVNMSTYVFDAASLRWALARLSNDNRQREYYITDCPGLLRRDGRDVRALPVLAPCEALSVNTVDELQIVEAEMRRLGYLSAR